MVVNETSWPALRQTSVMSVGQKLPKIGGTETVESVFLGQFFTFRTQNLTVNRPLIFFTVQILGPLNNTQVSSLFHNFYSNSVILLGALPDAANLEGHVVADVNLGRAVVKASLGHPDVVVQTRLTDDRVQHVHVECAVVDL